MITSVRVWLTCLAVMVLASIYFFSVDSRAQYLKGTQDIPTATLLPNGKVLGARGYNGGYLTTAELYANAAQDLIAYYNFEDGTNNGTPDYTAEPIAFVQASIIPGGTNSYANSPDAFEIANLMKRASPVG